MLVVIAVIDCFETIAIVQRLQRRMFVFSSQDSYDSTACRAKSVDLGFAHAVRSGDGCSECSGCKIQYACECFHDVQCNSFNKLALKFVQVMYPKDEDTILVRAVPQVDNHPSREIRIASLGSEFVFESFLT